MTIDQMLQEIKEYHKKLGYTYKYPSVEAQMEHFRSLALAQMMEIAETVDWTPWKPWRNVEDQKFNKPEAALELIDQFFFLAAQWFSLGLPVDAFDSYFNFKLRENLDRIDRGYNKTTETSKQEEFAL